ncbi:glycosyltransferase involved in cell wall biosynthesis [Arthrobacter sp. B2I5]|uniref:glycosyltransferase family 4 protein n=1 Tax=Arthrobacter sp. B2I5 TaxID=3042266 RepID=UPI00278695D5|nr:glycosyltransferase family 4 protein [Arthrobacter sp. B2I5]MDQ0824666.1 glycosyltransferase involved in cell wall biosynthesis [Arthrobacter sp. B2I5]
MRAKAGSPEAVYPGRATRVLVFAGAFSTSDDDRWLLDDLVDELVSQGSQVDVLAFDNTRVRPRGVEQRKEGRVRIISVGPERLPGTAADKILSRALSAVRMYTNAYGILKRQKYDIGVFTSVAATSAGLARRLRNKNVIKRLVFIQWDFFPIHQIEIGRLPGNPITRSLRHIESFCIAKSDVIAVMSPANERFLRSYFPKYRGRTMLLPPWAGSETCGEASKSERFKAMFGGQLVAGRGVESILRAAVLLGQQNVPIDIIIAGDGVLRHKYESLAASLELKNVCFLGSLPRPEYRSLLRTVHVGIAATVTGVSVPAFPSKIVEYCGSGIPVVACLDPASDGGDLLLEYEAGLVIGADDSRALADALQDLETRHRAGTLESMAESASRLFRDKFSCRSAALAILDSPGC